MSYDLFVWHRADGDPDELLERLSEGDAQGLQPHPDLGNFRRDLLTQLPYLAGLVEPEGEDETRYAIVPLPMSRAGDADVVRAIAATYGLHGWDPQLDEPLGQQPPRPASPARPEASDPEGRWTAEMLLGLGPTKTWIDRAWAAANLPPEVPFAHAVGAFMVAMAMREGEHAATSTAPEIVAQVVNDLHNGIPMGGAFVIIGSQMIDLPGYARALAQGSY